MEIVFVSSEMTPFAKTGGLADVVGVLPHEAAALGHSVSVFIPKYREAASGAFKLRRSLERLEIPVGSEMETGNVYTCAHGKVRVYFVDHAEYFDRDELYGTPMGDYPDNDRRFTFFQRTVLEALKRLKLKVDLIHCHDWQTGLVAVYLKTLYQSDPFFKDTRTVFTIHNLAYQGNFPPDSMSITGLSFDEFRYERLEFFGKISFIKGGVVYADAVTTVSERYAKEIQTKEMGCGLEGTLKMRSEDLYGIVNGIRPEDWDPERDPEIAARFSAGDLGGKQKCKEELQKLHALKPDPYLPLFAFVGRLVAQKGIDLLVQTIEDMVEEDWQLVLLGTGDEDYHKALRVFGKRHPKSVGLNITFDSRLAKQIYAGADMFLMPSQFEPCGLGQLISMRYGTVPVVRETGGLADTVEPFNPRTGTGNGFVFSRLQARDFMSAMREAAKIYLKDKKAWLKLMENGMSRDFSWHESARRYAELYRAVERKPLKV